MEPEVRESIMAVGACGRESYSSQAARKPGDRIRDCG
jgi:hypothetical protein